MPPFVRPLLCHQFRSNCNRRRQPVSICFQARLQWDKSQGLFHSKGPQIRRIQNDHKRGSVPGESQNETRRHLAMLEKEEGAGKCVAHPSRMSTIPLVFLSVFFAFSGGILALKTLTNLFSYMPFFFHEKCVDRCRTKRHSLA